VLCDAICLCQKQTTNNKKTNHKNKIQKCMLYALRCYMLCDVICFAMLYVYVKTQPTKKQKTKKKKVEGIICIVLSSFLFYLVFFCHSFLDFVTHFFICPAYRYSSLIIGVIYFVSAYMYASGVRQLHHQPKMNGK